MKKEEEKMPRDYSDEILCAVRQRLDLEEDDDSRDEEIRSMSPSTVFSHVLEWEGICGYDSSIKTWVEEIYGINLDEMVECNVDLSKTDTYFNYVIPDADIEIALKVIRTIRNAYLGGPQGFDANVTVLLSHAHGCISDMVKCMQDKKGVQDVQDKG